MPYIKKEGPHEVEIIEAEFGKKNNDKETPYFWLNGRNGDGDTIGCFLWLTEAAFDKTDKDLKEVFGFDGNYESAAGQVMGKQCQFVVELEDDREDPTKQWPRVRWINKAGSSGGIEHHKIPNQGDFLASLTRKSKSPEHSTEPLETAKAEGSTPPDFLA